jgi:hypothetical protein
MSMDIENLTIGEARRLAALLAPMLGGPAATTAQASPGTRMVVVTSTTRDVIYGEADGDAVDGKIVLRNARRVMYWGRDTGGLGGLSTRGPSADSKVGPVQPRVQITSVASVADCEAAAVKAFAAAGWAK